MNSSFDFLIDVSFTLDWNLTFKLKYKYQFNSKVYIGSNLPFLGISTCSNILVNRVLSFHTCIFWFKIFLFLKYCNNFGHSSSLSINKFKKKMEVILEKLQKSPWIHYCTKIPWKHFTNLVLSRKKGLHKSMGKKVTVMYWENFKCFWHLCQL